MRNQRRRHMEWTADRELSLEITASCDNLKIGPKATLITNPLTSSWQDPSIHCKVLSYLTDVLNCTGGLEKSLQEHGTVRFSQNSKYPSVINARVRAHCIRQRNTRIPWHNGTRVAASISEMLSVICLVVTHLSTGGHKILRTAWGRSNMPLWGFDYHKYIMSVHSTHQEIVPSSPGHQRR